MPRMNSDACQFQDQKARVPAAISRGAAAPAASRTKIRSPVGVSPLRLEKVGSRPPATTRWALSGDQGEWE